MMSNTVEDRLLIRLGYTGAPAFVQLGFMRALEEARISARVVATGLGAFVGALWACEVDLQRAASVLAHLPWNQVVSDFHGWVNLLVRGRKMEDLSRSLTIVTLDLHTGRREAIRTGPLAAAVRKAASLPGWLPPFQVGYQHWVDAGGLTPLVLQEIGIRSGGAMASMAPVLAWGEPGATPADTYIRLANAWHSEMNSTGKCMPSADFIQPVGPEDFHAIEVPALQVYRQAGAWFKDVRFKEG